jgi:hypothetical protein
MRNKTELRPKNSPPTLSPSEPSGLIAKNPRRSAGPKPVLDHHSHRTDLDLSRLPHYARAGTWAIGTFRTLAAYRSDTGGTKSSSGRLSQRR